MKDFKAGTYINQGYYKSFQPTELNKPWLLDDNEKLSEETIPMSNTEAGPIIKGSLCPQRIWIIRKMPPNAKSFCI